MKWVYKVIGKDNSVAYWVIEPTLDPDYYAWSYYDEHENFIDQIRIRKTRYERVQKEIQNQYNYQIFLMPNKNLTRSLN